MLALTLVLLSAGIPKAAAGTWAEVCKTTGAKGGLLVQGFEPGDKSIKLSMNVEDTKADGHHVAVRFVSKTNSGTVRFWSWHHNYGGLHHEIEFDTSATDSQGIRAVGFQVGRFEGSGLMNHCSAWASRY